MAVLPIVITGDPVLHTPAHPVGRIDDDVLALVADMIETMHAAPGVGLAAPQVGKSLRLFVWHWEEDEDEVHRGVAINPELWITPTRIAPADEDADSEGCLSIPGERFPLRRADAAILRAQGLDGHPFEIRATGWLARIFQHEYDHLNGVLYADRLEHAHGKNVMKAVKREGWGKPGKTWLPGVDHLEG
ncbi:MAG TPA: peptide deformylase [Microbacteriaceae bacterium]|nr:peptide deformylase [Microbacteriaceae bacterium]